MTSSKPLWSRGQMLSQQQLQAQDRFHEARLAQGVRAVHPYPWGFGSLEVDAEALEEGTFALLRAEGFLPDLLPFSLPDSDPAPAPLSLEPRWGPDRAGLPVYLAVPEAAPGSRLVSLEEGGRGTRFRSEVVLRRDENTGLQERPLQVARANLRLLAETDGAEGHVLLPVARVLRREGGGFVLDPDFLPPLLRTAAAPSLTRRLHGLVERVVARTAGLSGARRERGQGLAEFGVSDLANFWLLYTLNTHLPGLRQALEGGEAHPAELYQALCELVGALSTFSTRVDPAALPPYDHGAPGEGFRILDDLLRELLETVVPLNHRTVPLVEVEASIRGASLEDDLLRQARAVYLAVGSALPPEEVARRVPQLVKLGSGDQVRQLVRQALPGAALVHELRPPSAVPVRLDLQYFRLDATAGPWDAVRVARNVAAYIPVELSAHRVELVFLLGD
jgi:type VI secretion system protein ImpJ